MVLIGAVPADNHQTVDAMLMADFRTLLLSGLRLEFLAAGCAQHGAASLNDIGNAAGLHIHDFFI